MISIKQIINNFKEYIKERNKNGKIKKVVFIIASYLLNMTNKIIHFISSIFKKGNINRNKQGKINSYEKKIDKNRILYPLINKVVVTNNYNVNMLVQSKEYYTSLFSLCKTSRDVSDILYKINENENTRIINSQGKLISPEILQMTFESYSNVKMYLSRFRTIKELLSKDNITLSSYWENQKNNILMYGAQRKYFDFLIKELMLIRQFKIMSDKNQHKIWGIHDLESLKNILYKEIDQLKQIVSIGKEQILETSLITDYNNRFFAIIMKKLTHNISLVSPFNYYEIKAKMINNFQKMEHCNLGMVSLRILDLYKYNYNLTCYIMKLNYSIYYPNLDTIRLNNRYISKIICYYLKYIILKPDKKLNFQTGFLEKIIYETEISNKKELNFNFNKLDDYIELDYINENAQIEMLIPIDKKLVRNNNETNIQYLLISFNKIINNLFKFTILYKIISIIQQKFKF